MKNFTKRSILQKIIIAIVITLLLSNFIVPTYSHADWGGALMSPIVDLLCSLGDGIINMLQMCMQKKVPVKFEQSVGGGEVVLEYLGAATGFNMSAYLVEDSKFFAEENKEYYKEYLATSIPSGATSIKVDAGNEFEKGWFGLSKEYHIPTTTYSPEQIFAGNVSGLDINFINPNKYEDRNGNEIESSASILQPTIASWYVALRNLTVVGLLSILVYVGIRIIISSTASDKAKYKQMLVDWLVALCLVFFLHYIMSFTLTLTQSICEAIAGDGEANIYVEVDGGDGNESGIFKTNLLGLARFRTQYKDFGDKMAYLIMYLALVVYTCIFTWFYLKRLLMMAFLTLIAPVVALTYPIDKMNDGKAQAFNMWLKEYVFNALIQPFHLIIYTVFVGTAMDLATNNIIYMIAALAFIMPAEKILRKFFGFEKAEAGTLGAIAGGAALGSMASKAIKSIGSTASKVSSKSNDTKTEGDKPPRFEKKHGVNDIVEGISEGNAKNADKQTALDKYSQDGYGKNINGEYFNPWTEEYDSNYDPSKDPAYANQIQEQEEESKNSNKLKNWANAHNINAHSAAALGWRGIKGVAKFGTKTAFKAGAGTLAGAVALASGAGLGGALSAAATGATLGGKLGNGAIKLGSGVTRGAERTLGAVGIFGKEGVKVGIDARKQGNTIFNSTIQGIAGGVNSIRDKDVRSAASDRLLGGTALGREIDLASGNTRYQDAGAMRAIKEDKNNIKYLRDKMTADNGGVVPSDKKVKEEMNKLDPYITEGIKDIKEILKAQKAEQYGISSGLAAKIAMIGKEKGITAEILNDNKKAQAQLANLKQEFINKGHPEDVAVKGAERAINVLKAQNGVAHNLKKPKK